MPMTFEQFEERKVDERFLDLKRQAFLVQQRLKDVRKQVLALEEYVNDKQYSDQDKKFSSDEERDIRDDIVQEKGNLKSLFADVQSLERARARPMRWGQETRRAKMKPTCAQSWCPL